MFDLRKMPDYENKVVKLVNGKLLVNESVVDQNTFFQCKYANKFLKFLNESIQEIFNNFHYYK